MIRGFIPFLACIEVDSASKGRAERRMVVQAIDVDGAYLAASCEAKKWHNGSVKYVTGAIFGFAMPSGPDPKATSKKADLRLV